MFTAEFMLRKEFVVDSLYWINLTDFNLYMQSYTGNTNWGKKNQYNVKLHDLSFLPRLSKDKKNQKTQIILAHVTDS